MALNEPLANVTTIVQTPWFSDLKINTGNKFAYLKHLPDLIVLEASVIQILRVKLNLIVQTNIAHNKLFFNEGCGQITTNNFKAGTRHKVALQSD